MSLLSVLLQEAANLAPVAKMGAGIGAGIAAIGAGIGIGKSELRLWNPLPASQKA